MFFNDTGGGGSGDDSGGDVILRAFNDGGDEATKTIKSIERTTRKFDTTKIQDRVSAFKKSMHKGHRTVENRIFKKYEKVSKEIKKIEKNYRES